MLKMTNITQEMQINEEDNSVLLHLPPTLGWLKFKIQTKPHENDVEHLEPSMCCPWEYKMI